MTSCISVIKDNRKSPIANRHGIATYHGLAQVAKHLTLSLCCSSGERVNREREGGREENVMELLLAPRDSLLSLASSYNGIRCSDTTVLTPLFFFFFFLRIFHKNSYVIVTRHEISGCVKVDDISIWI